MQTHLLSEKERSIIREYLANKNKIGNFRLLKSRLLKNYDVLENDFRLIEKFKNVIAESD
jgi:hypothetical protein